VKEEVKEEPMALKTEILNEDKQIVQDPFLELEKQFNLLKDDHYKELTQEEKQTFDEQIGEI
jgi:hypothetical protein